MERGLRHDGSLSPYLFVIVAEALQISILEACRRGIFVGLSLVNDGANYCNCSLKVNPSKSILYGIGVELCEVIDVASSINCSHDSLPFSYLSLLVGKSMCKKEHLSQVLDSFHQDFHLRSLECYQSMVVLLSPKQFWESFENGGLGIGSIKAKNLRLLGKWRRRFHNEKEALWCKVITGVHGNEGGFNSGVGTANRKGVLENIVSDLDPGVVFTVNKLSKLLDSTILRPNVMMVNLDWNSWVPEKNNVFGGLRITAFPPSSNLKLEACQSFPAIELLEFVHLLSSLAKKNFQEVVYVTIRAIWDWHNRVLHTSSSCLHEDIFAKMQTLSLHWLSNRSRKKSLSWSN
ncbi:RNA-directed DNA polymerase, eukaryota, Reverse transcriptase zinc-binding domain protein [Artemisia annua]|uniref:RNA-directed DNA polymerase, eukaryota, Reverse transcriptase zinc-binding domain protein n=1 Tax=Artemisia annua TaxID=35608 RepID=A0A2U1PZL8_ARTAN|nr:RNA-directed DNA polymerase, eukaryota, Reverse transcriptase zinc-binding domain protein [Artemisia annua]